MIGIMEKGKKIPPQEASQTNPVAKPEDTKGGINNKVSSGLIGKLTLSSSLISAKAGIFQVSRVLYPWNFPKCHRLKNIRSVRLASRR